MLTFDIETAGTKNEEVIKKLAESIRPPGSIKKQESIDKWMEENYDQALKDKIADTALSGMYGHVTCIAVHCYDEIYSTSKNMTESDCLLWFHEIARDHNIFCGHNIHGFDLKFLKQRSIILDMKPAKRTWEAMNAKPWDSCIRDTMLMWSQDKNQMIGLDTLCWILGIDRGDTSITGSETAALWETDPQKVIDKCVNDVRKTVEVYNKLTFNDSVF